MAIRQPNNSFQNLSPGWLFAVICLLTVIIYIPGLSGDYMFDDMPNLLHNPQLDITSLDSQSMQGAVFSSGSGKLRRPVSMLSFTLNRYFFGIDPYSHKVVNLIIHILTGIGLYLAYPAGNSRLPIAQTTGTPCCSAEVDAADSRRTLAGAPAEPDTGTVYHSTHDQPGHPVYRPGAMPLHGGQNAHAGQENTVCR